MVARTTSPRSRDPLRLFLLELMPAFAMLGTALAWGVAAILWGEENGVAGSIAWVGFWLVLSQPLIGGIGWSHAGRTRIYFFTCAYRIVLFVVFIVGFGFVYSPCGSGPECEPRSTEPLGISLMIGSAVAALVTPFVSAIQLVRTLHRGPNR